MPHREPQRTARTPTKNSAATSRAAFRQFLFSLFRANRSSISSSDWLPACKETGADTDVQIFIQSYKKSIPLSAHRPLRCREYGQGSHCETVCAASRALPVWRSNRHIGNSILTTVLISGLPDSGTGWRGQHQGVWRPLPYCPRSVPGRRQCCRG